MTWTMPWPGSSRSNIAIPLAEVSARKPFQQFQPDLAGSGAAMRRGNRVVRRCKGQFGIVDLKLAALEVKQAARAAEIMQQMAIDMEKISVVADVSDDMLVPDLGQHGAARRGVTGVSKSTSLFGHGLSPSSAVYGLDQEGLIGPWPWGYQSIIAYVSARVSKDDSVPLSGRYSRRPAKVFAKVWTSPGHRAET